MAERLVIVSDMWGSKKGLWITSYLGYLQQYYDITFYDSQQLANIDLKINTQENIHSEFVNGGIDTAAAHLVKRESNASHYLAFSTGGTIVWKAGLMGLPIKSLYAVSATRIRKENEKPDTPVTLIYGANDKFKPSEKWANKVGVDLDIVQNFGHTMYSDEKIIQKVCLELLSNATQKLDKKKVV